jgi:hypothetical protein
MAALTTEWAERLGHAILRDQGAGQITGHPWYLRIFAADPGKAGDMASEAAGGGYTGQLVEWAHNGSHSDVPLGTFRCSNTLTYPNMPAGTWTHWGLSWEPNQASTLFGAVNVARLAIIGSLVAPRTTIAGQSLIIAPFDFGVTFS